MRAGISESTRPAAAKELDRPQIINNRPLAVSLPRPDEFLRFALGVRIGLIGPGFGRKPDASWDWCPGLLSPC